MEHYFSKFRKHIIGIDAEIDTPFDEKKKIVYADWTASGRCYGPVEDKLRGGIMPYVSNVHTESSGTGRKITRLYKEAKSIIKKHVHADDDYALISTGSGMTESLNLFQQMLGLKIPRHLTPGQFRKPKEKPIVFVSHMEHHSNQISWAETLAEVKIIPADNGRFSLNALEAMLKTYPSGKVKIAAITACSNVTGEFTPYHEVARLMHAYNGYCFVDMAACAPYIDINVKPDNGREYLDAVYYSTHKFLGGPGSTGILVFSKHLYPHHAPVKAGGDTVTWTNPWGGYNYFEDIETREDGGTPAFLQTIKAAMCHQLKDAMTPENMLQREHQLLQLLLEKLIQIPHLHLLGHDFKNRLGIVSFYIDGLHYDLGVRMLNDYFGIQARGGCSCAGTYGHYLLNIDKAESDRITGLIDKGDFSQKPGWIRLSLHPTMTDDEIMYLAGSIRELAENHKSWAGNYVQEDKKNSFSLAINGKKRPAVKNDINQIYDARAYF